MRPRTKEEWKTLINCVISAASSRQILSDCHLVTINSLILTINIHTGKKIGSEVIQIKLWKEKLKER